MPDRRLLFRRIPLQRLLLIRRQIQVMAMPMSQHRNTTTAAVDSQLLPEQWDVRQLVYAKKMTGMKSIKTIFSFPILICGLFLGTPAFAQSSNSIPAELRPAGFACDKATIQIALELNHAGWTYHMPEPKSPQAAWGNGDGRTTWWIGYWTNKKDHSTSLKQPKANDAGKLEGDDKWVSALGDGVAVRRHRLKYNVCAPNQAESSLTDIKSPLACAACSMSAPAFLLSRLQTPRVPPTMSIV